MSEGYKWLEWKPMKVVVVKQAVGCDRRDEWSAMGHVQQPLWTEQGDHLQSGSWDGCNAAGCYQGGAPSIPAEWIMRGYKNQPIKASLCSHVAGMELHLHTPLIICWCKSSPILCSCKQCSPPQQQQHCKNLILHKKTDHKWNEDTEGLGITNINTRTTNKTNGSKHLKLMLKLNYEAALTTEMYRRKVEQAKNVRFWWWSEHAGG